MLLIARLDVLNHLNGRGVDTHILLDMLLHGRDLDGPLHGRIALDAWHHLTIDTITIKKIN